MNKSISIVGGGFSGLTLAYFLHKKGFQICLYEKAQWGGLLQSHTANGYVVEEAANALLWSSLLQNMADDIKCELVTPLPESKNKWIWKSGLSRMPIGFKSILKIISFIFFYLFFRSQLRPKTNESIKEWSLRCLNLEILEYLISPALQGIYAGDTDKLSASLILSSIFNKGSKKKGSVAPLNGMSELIKSLKNYLSQNNVKFESKEIKSLSEIEAPFVLATSFKELIRLRPELNNNKIEQLNLVRITTDFAENPTKKIEGFGVLYPAKENFNSLGTLFNSSIFPFNQKTYNESWILGGATHPKAVQLNENELKSKVKQDRSRLFLENFEFKNFFVKKHIEAYVHYDINLENWLNLNQNLLQDDKNLKWTTGNFLGKLGLSNILEQNFSLANRINEVVCQK